ncbi:MAG: hypothetical protein AAFV47_09235 [Pseudomonadota bacterium]
MGRFGDFWAIYPRKEAQVPAKRIWNAQGLDSIADTIIADVQKRIALHSQWQDPQYIPHPDRYLREERWNDEINETNSGRRSTSRRHASFDEQLRELERRADLPPGF